MAAGGGGDAQLVLAGEAVGLETAGGGLAFGVGQDGEGAGAVREGGAGALVGQQKDDGGAGDGLAVLIFDLHNGIAGDALAGIIDGAVTFDDHDVELAGWLMGNGTRLREYRKQQRASESLTAWPGGAGFAIRLTIHAFPTVFFSAAD